MYVSPFSNSEVPYRFSRVLVSVLGRLMALYTRALGNCAWSSVGNYLLFVFTDFRCQKIKFLQKEDIYFAAVCESEWGEGDINHGCPTFLW